MNIYQPTYLYIKEHSVTKLKYFGKTKYNPEHYFGSGKYWLSHINKHGKEHVHTVWAKLFYTKEELIEFACAFSEIYDIVDSNEWANLCPENGTDGGVRANNHLAILNLLPRAAHHSASLSTALKGRRPKQICKAVTINNNRFDAMIDASRFFKVTEQTIYNWIKSGKAIKS